jgi:glycosyltransferase involved in cell wall biosynthesis
MPHKIAFVVPTKDREKDLRSMLSSLACQTRIPDQIIVVDGSEPDINFVVKEFDNLPIEYVREYPPSLSKQRNAGIAKLKKEITLAGYLDDDLELEPNAVENMLVFWEESGTEYGGAAFSITNVAEPSYTKFKQLFGLDATKRGKVLPTGWVSMLGNVKQNTDVDWLCGGVTIWRREIVDKYPYDEWFQGTGFMEDVDFSFNVRGKYKLALIADAKVAHYQHPILPSRYVLFGKWQITNRMYFVRKYRDRGLSLYQAWISNFSIMFLNIFIGIVRFERNRLRCAIGNLIGIGITLIKKDKQIGGYLK